MFYYIFSQPGFQSSSWYNQIIEGLTTEKRTKRLKMITVPDEMFFSSQSVTELDVLLLIGTDEKWILRCVSLCEQYFKNRIIVLGNFKRGFSEKKFSIVSSDITNDVALLYNYLKHYNKNKIALYGVNRNSASDMCRKSSFLNLHNEKEEDVYYNNGSLSQCYLNFSENASNYDAVICVNDYAAISLISNLKNPDIFIVSLSGTHLAGLHKPTITNLKTNYEEFGTTFTEVSRLFSKNNHISSVDIYLSSTLNIGETTNALPLPENLSISALNFNTYDSFYNDQEINRMISIEKLLMSCSDEDFRIIERILQNATYSELSDEFYMSVSGIKYKLKKMFDICGVTTKTAFSELLKSYIKNEN